MSALVKPRLTPQNDHYMGEKNGGKEEIKRRRWDRKREEKPLLLIFERSSGVFIRKSVIFEMFSKKKKCSFWQKSDVNIMFALFSFQISEHAEDVACNALKWIYSFAWSASTSHCAAAQLSLLPVTWCQKPHGSRETCGQSGRLGFPRF